MTTKAIKAPKATTLTAEEKSMVRKDFEDWSGGFTPYYSDEDEIKIYLRATAPAHLKRSAVKAFLEEWSKEERAEKASARET